MTALVLVSIALVPGPAERALAQTTLAGTATNTNLVQGVASFADWNNPLNWTAGVPAATSTALLAGSAATPGCGTTTCISFTTATQVGTIEFTGGTYNITSNPTPPLGTTINTLVYTGSGAVGIGSGLGYMTNTRLPFVAPTSITAPIPFPLAPSLTIGTPSGGGVINNTGTRQNFTVGYVATGTYCSGANPDNCTQLTPGQIIPFFAGFHSSIVFTGSATVVGPVTFTTNAIPNPFVGVAVQQEGLIFAGDSSAGSNQTTIQNQAGLGTTGFYDYSSAGSAIINDISNGYTYFHDHSSAANATITNVSGGTISFDNSTLGNAHITNGNASAAAGLLSFPFDEFNGNSTAGNATITNNAGVVFLGSSNAGTATITNNNRGQTTFNVSSSASQATLIVNSGGAVSFNSSPDTGTSPPTAADAVIIVNSGGSLSFNPAAVSGIPSPTADHATITNAGATGFFGASTAGDSSITISSGGVTTFHDSSTGGTASIKTNGGGLVSFLDSSTGGAARFITGAGGTFDMSTLTAAGMTAGSIEGAGNYFLGSKALTTGLNNLSTTVSGLIEDGGAGGGVGGSLIQSGAGTLTLSAANTYTGPTTIMSGAINLTGSLLSPVFVRTAGTLGSTGTVFNTVTNAGTVAPGFELPTTQFGTLTVNNYVGSAGVLALRTVLGGDSSPTDLLSINGGSAIGSTGVLVTNVGGTGAQTANGIMVVQALNGATTAPTAFTLLNTELRAGAYDYELFRGSPNDSNPAVANDWFLRSTFVVPPTLLPTLPPVLGTTPPPATLPPGVYPIIGPELATYGVVQPLARELGLAILDTLDDRVGDTYEADGCSAGPAVNSSAPPPEKVAPPPSNCPPSVWGRFFGQTIDEHYQAFADPRASGNLGGLQGGIDLLRGSHSSGHFDRAGLYGAFGDESVNVDGLVTNSQATGYALTRTGSLSLKAWTGGAYWTHVGPGGWYLDTVVQGTSYSGAARTQFARLDTGGWGFIGSLEAGVPFALGRGFVLEPQAQIVWQEVSFSQRNDGLGEVDLAKTTGSTGRLGLRGKWTIVSSGGQVWEPYLRVNFWKDWGAQANAVYSGASVVPLLTTATRLQFGGGLTGRINANSSFYANVDYQFATGNTTYVRRDSVRGAVGLRYSW